MHKHVNNAYKGFRSVEWELNAHDVQITLRKLVKLVNLFGHSLKRHDQSRQIKFKLNIPLDWWSMDKLFMTVFLTGMMFCIPAVRK